MSDQLLQSLNDLPVDVKLPAYAPQEHGVGIVHIGFGAFHKAHQAVYTDEALAVSGGDWRIVGVSLRSTTIAEKINKQNGLYTLISQSGLGSSARIIASVDRVLCAKNHSDQILEVLCHTDTRIVSITVTEKGYGINRETGGVALADSVIAHDLRHSEQPQGVIGFIVCALSRRLANNIPAFTILCCDNLPDNGQFVRGGVIDFAQRIDPSLAQWIRNNVAFPSSMVDRITPASTQGTQNTAHNLIGVQDFAAIETEPFHQWVIEDWFSSGRPDWEAGGAVVTKNIAPYEEMKLRMLNGSHSMLAYAGYLLGHQYVRDVTADSSMLALITRHLASASLTLDPLPGVDLDDYASRLIERFRNPAIAHATYQIAMDGSQKMPQRIFDPALCAIGNNQDVRPYAFAAALWMRYCFAETDNGHTYKLQDPLADQLELAVSHTREAAQIIQRISDIPVLIPKQLSSLPLWNDSLLSSLQLIIDKGVRAAIDFEAQTFTTFVHGSKP